MEWLTEYWQALTWGRILFGVGIFILSALISVIVVAIVVVKLPANYFSSHYQEDFLPNTPWLVRWGVVIAKNLIGLILVLAGIAMLIGPGQGILTILIGLVLMDIPGKKPFEAKIINRPNVLPAVNKLRKKYNKPPLVMD
jgi:uncharacterized membrane protein